MKQNRTNLVLLVTVWLLAACVATPPPLYEGLGDSGRAVSTDVDEAQVYFDQGLALCWGFNHDEALRSFQEAARLDPDCAMAYWGQAYALGPNINRLAIDKRTERRAFKAAQRARAKSAGSSELEQALIEALTHRYALPPPDDRTELTLDYADAMREVWRRYPDDPLVGTLFADALMNISNRWRDWETEEGRGEYTPEIVATLEAVLAVAPEHAGANHFYIHSVEASDRPERGLASADRLEGLMPAAGHMVHMPSHIYVRLGMYDEAVATNARAIREDDRFFAEAPRSGIYHLYRAHNHHFLIWSAMFRGSYGDAMTTARAMVAKLPDGKQSPRIEVYHIVPLHVMMRFGLWDDILAEPAPGRRYKITTALWHQVRAVANANTGRLAEARAEAEQFEKAARPLKKDAEGPFMDGLLDAARNMMWGEILYKEGDPEAAFAALRKGVDAEDSLPYAEPPAWMQPVRHALGALLLESGRVEEAEAVYREDLDRHADNVWALSGLAECLRSQGREAEADAAEARLLEASRHADVPIRASCYCRTFDA